MAAIRTALQQGARAARHASVAVESMRAEKQKQLADA